MSFTYILFIFLLSISLCVTLFTLFVSFSSCCVYIGVYCYFYFPWLSPLLPSLPSFFSLPLSSDLLCLFSFLFPSFFLWCHFHLSHFVPSVSPMFHSLFAFVLLISWNISLCLSYLFLAMYLPPLLCVSTPLFPIFALSNGYCSDFHSHFQGALFSHKFRESSTASNKGSQLDNCWIWKWWSLERESDVQYYTTCRNGSGLKKQQLIFVVKRTRREGEKERREKPLQMLSMFVFIFFYKKVSCRHCTKCSLEISREKGLVSFSLSP